MHHLVQTSTSEYRKSTGKLVSSIDVSGFSLVSEGGPSDRSAGGGVANRLVNSSISLTNTPSTPVIPEYEMSREDWDLVREYEEAEGFGVGFVVNKFPSGEVTAGCFSRSAIRKPPVRSKELVSSGWSAHARKSIRRAVECASSQGLLFRSFCTLTFDARLPHVKKDDHGRVCQKWAQGEVERFLNTVGKCYTRRYEQTQNPLHRWAFVRVGEVQPGTGNIHYHILFSVAFVPWQYINKIWRNGATNIKRVNDARRAARYITKYMGKDSTPIMGRRYSMSQNLYDVSAPSRFSYYGRSARSAYMDAVRSLCRDIERNGGRVFDWGMFIPAPSRPRKYRLPDGSIGATSGTSLRCSERFLSSFLHLTPEDYPF